MAVAPEERNEPPVTDQNENIVQSDPKISPETSKYEDMLEEVDQLPTDDNIRFIPEDDEPKTPKDNIEVKEGTIYRLDPESVDKFRKDYAANEVSEKPKKKVSEKPKKKVSEKPKKKVLKKSQEKVSEKPKKKNWLAQKIKSPFKYLGTKNKKEAGETTNAMVSFFQ